MIKHINMPQVHILPENIISKIAAGEVIERPASVVKELLENALDSGADTIEIHLQDAGKTSIHLKDNGCGIAHEDLETIFLRHATSKIQTVDDLYNIHSLGFRGEALYSIGAIADVTIRSKIQDSETGWEIHLRGGKKLDLRPSGINKGTEIEIKELFYNTPARKKFLKTNTSELNQILNIFTPFVLLYPQLRFCLTHQDKKLFDLSPTENWAERAAKTLNLNNEYMLEVDQTITQKNIRIHMLLGNINIVRSRRDMQFIFVNDRPVQSKNISFHMNNVYRLIFPPNKYPFFVLNIQIPGEDVDVNIHPTKREVKIKGEEHICAFLRRICEKALLAKGDVKKATLITKQETDYILSPSKPTSKPTYKKPTKPYEPLPTTLFENTVPYDKPTPTEQHSFPETSFSNLEKTFQEKQHNTLHNKLAQAVYIGTFMNKYLLFEKGTSLLLIDQHAMAERVTFEKLIVQMEKGTVEAQNLLSPDLISVTRQEMLAWEENKEELEAAGFTSTQFDPQTIAIHSYPTLIKDPQKAVQDILAGEKTIRCDHETLARRACRSSIMTGDKLHKEEIEHLRQKLLECLDPFTCPHGRPTIIEMEEGFIDKQFLRV
ncbi:DNA mismatch repair protein MutL [hydrothermal vent metagenome]|uniref:DNA mismatch repair protein MutL n=1 Tax=hydrothermal vent metagenome TaxID=652676 RepID=A0A3B1D626_9ZZZZ